MIAVEQPRVGLQHVENSCKINVNNSYLGEGTLYIAESELIWIGPSNQGLRLQYSDIAIHAISTDLQSFPEECLYVMYNKSFNETPDNDSDDDSESNTGISEVRFIPQNKNNLKEMFDALSACQCLHPPDDDDSDYCEESPHIFGDGAAGEQFFTGDEALQHMTPQGLATMHRLEAMLNVQQSHSNSEPTEELEHGINGVQITEGHNGKSDDGQFDDA